MRILVACERSGKVRQAFRLKGHQAYSCDIVDADDSQDHHIKSDAALILNQQWDMVIAFPPCTHLSSSGARWFKQKQDDGRQQKAVEFFMLFARCNAPKVAIENPIGIMSSKYRRPDQIIQPWQFGHGETKATCLWLKNLPLLKPTQIVEGREPRIWKMGPSEERAKLRSETYQGIANAMAEQWSNL